MGMTTTKPRPELVNGALDSLPSSPAPVDDTSAPSELLVKEARRRRRQRWGFSALGLAAMAALIAALVNASGGSAPPSRTGHGPVIASPGDVAAFAARAEKGFFGKWLLRYSIEYTAGPRGSVVVAQISRTRWAYFSTPPVTDIRSSAATSSVFVNPIGDQAGRYFCWRRSASSGWKCSDFSSAGMGTNAQLLGPYPPTALIRGLQSAIVEYSGKITGEHVAPEPAYLVTRQTDARTYSCLAFGKPAHPVALVCLNAADLIVSYDIPGTATSIAYSKAELRTQSRAFASTLVGLPTVPSAAS